MRSRDLMWSKQSGLHLFYFIVYVDVLSPILFVSSVKHPNQHSRYSKLALAMLIIKGLFISIQIQLKKTKQRSQISVKFIEL